MSGELYTAAFYGGAAGAVKRAGDAVRVGGACIGHTQVARLSVQCAGFYTISGREIQRSAESCEQVQKGESGLYVCAVHGGGQGGDGSVFAGDREGADGERGNVGGGGDAGCI